MNFKKKIYQKTTKNFKLIMLITVLLTTVLVNLGNAQQTAYVVAITGHNEAKPVIHKPIDADSLLQLIEIEFNRCIDGSHFLTYSYFQFSTDKLDFYCEKKRIKKVKRNGKVVLKRIRGKYLKTNHL